MTDDASVADDGRIGKIRRVTPVRALLGLAGLGALAVAVAAPGGPVEGAVAAALAVAGSEYLLAAGIGVATLAVGLAAFLAGRDAATQTRTPDPERPVPVPAPGEPFDEAAGDWRCLLPLVGRERRASVRERLRRTAIDVVAVAEDCDRETATDRVDRGTWTDDDVAAAFLAGTRGSSVRGGSSPGRRLAPLLRGRTPTGYRAERTVDAIASVAGVDPEGES